MSTNQNPEQKARDNIDEMLSKSGWVVQGKNKIDFSAGDGIAVREYPTDSRPVDYALFVNKQALGVIEAKPEEYGHKITTVEEQSERYADSKLKHLVNNEPLPFVYEATGIITKFTKRNDPKPSQGKCFHSIVLKLWRIGIKKNVTPCDPHLQASLF